MYYLFIIISILFYFKILEINIYKNINFLKYRKLN